MLKTVKRHWEINLDFLKLKLRDITTRNHCPICNKHLSKIKTISLCEKCEEKFSNLAKDRKTKLTRNVRKDHLDSDCFLCSKKNLKNRHYYCLDCDISFHQ